MKKMRQNIKLFYTQFLSSKRHSIIEIQRVFYKQGILKGL